MVSLHFLIQVVRLNAKSDAPIWLYGSYHVRNPVSRFLHWCYCPFAQRKFLIQRGPCQPALKSFPVNETLAKNKQNKFNPSWYDSSIAERKIKHFVLYARSFHLGQEEKEVMTHGLKEYAHGAK